VGVEAVLLCGQQLTIDYATKVMMAVVAGEELGSGALMDAL
jgi:hypothetical protein